MVKQTPEVPYSKAKEFTDTEVSQKATKTYNIEQAVLEDVTAAVITKGYKRSPMNMRLKYHISRCKAVMLELGGHHITFPAVAHCAGEQVQQEEASLGDLPADSLPPGLIVMPGHIAQALQGRLSSMQNIID